MQAKHDFSGEETPMTADGVKMVVISCVRCKFTCTRRGGRLVHPSGLDFKPVSAGERNCDLQMIRHVVES